DRKRPKADDHPDHPVPRAGEDPTEDHSAYDRAETRQYRVSVSHDASLVDVGTGPYTEGRMAVCPRSVAPHPETPRSRTSPKEACAGSPRASSASSGLTAGASPSSPS